MKLLLVADDMSLFSAESRAYKTILSFSSMVDEIHVLSRAPRGTKPSQQGNIFLHPVTVFGWLYIHVMIERARHIVLYNSIDIVSAQDAFSCGEIAYTAIKNTNATFHLQLHTDFFASSNAEARATFSTKNRNREQHAKNILSKAKGVRAVSKRIRDTIQTMTPPIAPGIEYIPNGILATIPEKKFLPARGYNFTFITVCSTEKERTEDVMRALELVRGIYPRAGLCIIANETQQHFLQKKTKSLHLEDAITFLDGRSDVRAFLQDATAYIQADAYETYGTLIIEAAFCHVPVITTSVGIVGDILLPNQDVLIVPVGEISDIAFQMRTMIEDQRLRHVLAISARSKIIRSFVSEEETAKAIVANYAKTLSSV